MHDSTRVCDIVQHKKQRNTKHQHEKQHKTSRKDITLSVFGVVACITNVSDSMISKARDFSKPNAHWTAETRTYQTG